MNNIVIALIIGISAGLLDVTPMIIQKLDKTANWSAFVHWVVLGLIIPFVHWDIQPWLKGLIIGELATLPVRKKGPDSNDTIFCSFRNRCCPCRLKIYKLSDDPECRVLSW
jgi:hypothetical protein